MSDKLEALEQRVNKVLAELDRLRSENKRLQVEKGNLLKEVQQIKLSQSDLTGQVQRRLNLVLQRIEELETLS